MNLEKDMFKTSWKIWLRNVLLALVALVIIYTAAGFYLMSKGNPQESATANEVLNCGSTVAPADCTPQKRREMDLILGKGVNPEDLTSKYKSIATDNKHPRLEDREKNRKELTKGW